MLYYSDEMDCWFHSWRDITMGYLILRMGQNYLWFIQSSTEYPLWAMSSDIILTKIEKDLLTPDSTEPTEGNYWLYQTAWYNSTSQTASYFHMANCYRKELQVRVRIIKLLLQQLWLALASHKISHSSSKGLELICLSILSQWQSPKYLHEKCVPTLFSREKPLGSERAHTSILPSHVSTACES